jgi:hypothetical protein
MQSDHGFTHVQSWHCRQSGRSQTEVALNLQAFKTPDYDQLTTTLQASTKQLLQRYQ